MEEYKLIEFRPNRYAKVVDGEVVGIASYGEIQSYFYKRKYSDVGAEAVEMSLALTAIAGALLSLGSWSVVVFWVEMIAFGLGLLSTQYLYWVYILQRVPLLWTVFGKFCHSREWVRRIPYAFNIWLLCYYPILFFKMAFYSLLYPKGVTRQLEVEFGYLSLLVVFYLLSIALMLIVI